MNIPTSRVSENNSTDNRYSDELVNNTQGNINRATATILNKPCDI
jgi:hypothetical protein